MVFVNSAHNDSGVLLSSRLCSRRRINKHELKKCFNIVFRHQNLASLCLKPKKSSLKKSFLEKSKIIYVIYVCLQIDPDLRFRSKRQVLQISAVAVMFKRR